MPLGRLVVVIERAAITDMVNAFEAVRPAASLASTVKVEELAAAGVPEMVPEVLRARPAGNWPDAMLQVYGVVPPVAARVAL